MRAEYPNQLDYSGVVIRGGIVGYKLRDGVLMELAASMVGAFWIFCVMRDGGR